MTLTYLDFPTIQSDYEQKNSEDPLKEVKAIVQKLRYNLFDIWKEEEDPTLYYYPSIPSYTDYDLLMLQIRRKKIFGLFILLNFINVLNLIFPAYDPCPKNVNLIEMEAASDKGNLSNTNQSYWFSTERYKCIVNLIVEAGLFCISVNICFCS